MTVHDLPSKCPRNVVKDLQRSKNVGVKPTFSEIHVALKEYIEQTEGLSDLFDELQSFNSPSTTAPRQQSFQGPLPNKQQYNQRNSYGNSKFHAPNYYSSRTDPTNSPMAASEKPKRPIILQPLLLFLQWYAFQLRLCRLRNCGQTMETTGGIETL